MPMFEFSSDLLNDIATFQRLPFSVEVKISHAY